jgi:hypothetical protein
MCERTETTIEKIREQPDVTTANNHGESLSAQQKATDSSDENLSGSADENMLVEKPDGEQAHNTASDSVRDRASRQPSDQTNQSSSQVNQRVARRVPGRPTLKMTKEQLMAAITEITEKLGHVPSYAELMKTGKVSGRQIVKHFATYTRALRACNLERVCGGNKLPLERLFLDWATVTRQLGKIPSKAEFAQMGKHSDTPLKSRFGSWGQVPRYLRRYIEEQGRTEAIGQSKNSPQWTQSSQRKSWLLLTFAFFASFAVTCFRAEC